MQGNSPLSKESTQNLTKEFTSDSNGAKVRSHHEFKVHNFRTGGFKRVRSIQNLQVKNKSSRKSILKEITEVYDEMAEIKPTKQVTLSHQHSEKREALLKGEEIRLIKGEQIKQEKLQKQPSIASHDEEHHVRFNLHSMSSNDDQKKDKFNLEVKTSKDKISGKRKLEESTVSPNHLTENVTPDYQPSRTSIFQPKTILKQRSQRISKLQLQDIQTNIPKKD